MIETNADDTGAVPPWKGLRVGLEIHQQLDTGKLFCRCPSTLVDEEGVTVKRRLHPSAGEIGEFDPAAMFEASRGQEFIYQAPSTTCPVELDEEPPGEVDATALGIALTIAMMLDAVVPPEIHFMRKIVIDGSNTTGFQRTAIVGTHGRLPVDGKNIDIPTICLEEDAARRIPDARGAVFRLDRQGIPLVEIATGPDIASPEEAGKVAKAIGDLVRATRKVKRGLGTIREDLNVSIEGGARVEIKGVQDLSLIPDYVRDEAGRQADLLAVREILASKGASVGEPVPVTRLFAVTNSTVLKRSMADGGIALAVRMPGFAGTYAEKHSCRKGRRVLGPELADHARLAGLGGLFHSDELPGYGVTTEETAALASFLGCAGDDGFVMVAGPEARCRKAMDGIIARARKALEGVPGETREPLPEGETCYARPLPGGSRMYPETDVPAIIVDDALLDSLRKNLPEPLDALAKRLSEQYRIHPQQAGQIVREELEAVFEAAAGRDKTLMGPLAARTLLATAPELEKEKVDASHLREKGFLTELLGLVADGTIAREGVAEVARLAITQGKRPAQVVRDRGMKLLGEEDVRKALQGIVDRNSKLVEQKGKGAVGPLMGEAMKELAGKADGKLVSRIIAELISGRNGK